MSRTPSLRTVAAAASFALLATGVALGAVPAHAVSPDLTVSQIYGGGGNSGATLTNDYIEIHNHGGATVDLNGWSVQYASAAGASWQVTALTGEIRPGEHYLVQEAAGAGGTTALPVPDAIGGISMAAASGKVALVNATAPLSCGADCDAAPGVRDFVGYGSANEFETAPAPGLSNTTAALRAGGGTTDTDNNAEDFASGAPNPSSTGRGVQPGGVSGKRIHDIQGAAHRSQLVNQKVLQVPGVVSVVSRNGFWFQDPEPDADPATSEGLFVFTSVAPAVSPGDVALVDATVSEFRPGGDANNLTTTELTAPSVTVTGQAPVPAPVLIGPGGLEAPAQNIDDDATGDVETTGSFEPASDAIDFYESLEGMLVQIDDAEVVGPTASFGEIPVLPGGTQQGLRTVRGGVLYDSYGAPNAQRLQLDDALIGRAAMPNADVGDVLAGPTVGVMDYSFANFKILVTAPPVLVDNGPAREITDPERSNQLSVATFNVENLHPVAVEREGETQSGVDAKYAALARTVVTSLRAPDVVALEEVQDNTGPDCDDNNGCRPDGVVDASVTLAKLVAAIGAAGGPRYEFRQINPIDLADGGQPSGNIRVAFLFNPQRGLKFVDRPGGGPDVATAVVRVKNEPALTASPGRIDPANPAFEDSRKPLATEFTFRGRTVFVIANHFLSKGGDQPLFGRFQPPARASESQRHAQAAVVRDFADRILAIDRNARIVVAGDLNDFEFSQTADILAAGGALVDLPRTLPPAERYTYVFEGNSQVLDHILISRQLAEHPASGCRCRTPYEYDVVHVNSEYSDQVSDHEPQVVRLTV